MKRANKLITLLTGVAMLAGTSCNKRMYLQGNAQAIPENLKGETRLQLLKGIELTGGLEQATFNIENITQYEQDYSGKVVGINFYNKHVHFGTSLLIPNEKSFTNEDDYWLIDRKPEQTNNSELREHIDLEAKIVGLPGIQLSYNIPIGAKANISLGGGYRPLSILKTGTLEQYVWEDDIQTPYADEIKKTLKFENINEKEDKSSFFFRLGMNLGYMGVWLEAGGFLIPTPDTRYFLRAGGTINIPLQQQTKLKRK